MPDLPTRDLPPHGHPTADPSAAGRTGDLTSGPTDAPGETAPGAGGDPPAVPGYELAEEVGRGGMGVVYRARDLTFGRDVAVKLLQDKYPADGVAARRFLDEARITGQLQHPGVPAAYQTGTLPDGRPFLAMKLIKGQTLADLIEADGGREHDSDVLASGGREPPGGDAKPVGAGDQPGGSRPPLARTGQRPVPHSPNLVAAFEGVCQAVGYAHAHGVIHRDLKPANVMVGAFGEVQVMDWGLAKLLADRRPDPADPDATAPGTEFVSTRDADDATRAGSLLGTPAYMSPEQAIGAVDEVDWRSDVFGLGAVLCTILTGKPPYAGGDHESTRKRAARAELDDAMNRLGGCGADPGLVDLCRRCLSPKREDRPADAGVVAAEVAALRAAADDRARQAELDRVRAEGDLKAAEVEAAEGRKRRRVQRLLAAAAVLLLAAGGAFAWWEDKRAGERKAEAAAAEARARQAVESAVTLSAELRGKYRFIEARAALDHAAGLVPADAPADIRDRLDRARDELEFVRELDAIRVSRVTGADFRSVDEVMAEYRAAFRARGIDPATADPALTAEWVAASGVKPELVAALDDWAWMAGKVVQGTAVRDRLLAATRQADPGPWSDRVRDPAAWRDEAALDRLTAGLDVSAVPPGLFVLFCQQRTKPWVGARRMLREAAIRHPGDFWVHFEAGHYFTNKDYDPAVALGYLGAARALRPDNAQALAAIGVVLRDADDVDGAVGCFRAAAELTPGLARAHHMLEEALLLKGDVAGAAECRRKVLRLEPGYYDQNRGFVINPRGDPAKVAAAVQKAVRLDSTDANALGYLAQARTSRGDRAGAVDAYRAAVRLDPGNARRQRALGYALVQVSRSDEAVAALREAVRLDPRDDENHYYLGYALRQTGDVGGAVSSLREAIRLDPNDVESHRYLGQLLGEGGDLDAAVLAYREAVRLDPDYGRLLRGAERERDLVPRLAAIAAGRVRPTSPADAIRLAGLADRPLRREYDLAVWLYSEAFAADANLADAVKSHRYNAACAAVRAAAGDDPSAAVGWDEWGILQDRAHAWLAADLADFRRRAGLSIPTARQFAADALAHWLADPDLALVRDPARRANMPAPDRERWDRFWAEVEAVRQSALPAVAPPPREAGR